METENKSEIISQKDKELIRMYEDDFEFACEAPYYNFGFEFWYGHCDIEDARTARRIWELAQNPMSREI